MITYITLNKKNIVDFAKERNELLKKAKSEWVLFLDSDEKLSKPISDLSDKYDGYILKRKNYFLGQYVGTDNIVRLGKKNAGRWKRIVHETWDINKVHLGSVLNSYIIHNTANNLKEYINKMNYYSDLHARANKEEDKSSNIFKIIFFPLGKFVVTLIKSKNVVFSIMQSLHSFLSWTKLYFLYS